MGKIIAGINEKGGVSKTTTIKNLSIGLARRGKRVLAIDFDPSAMLTKVLGMYDGESNETIVEIIQKTIECEDIPDMFGIRHHEEGIDVIISKPKLHVCEDQLASAFQRETVLRRYLETVQGNYDYIFVDCPAGIGILSTNVLFCADDLIIPLEPNYADIEALQNLFPVIGKVRKLQGARRKPDILGVLFTKVRDSTKNHRENIRECRNEYEGSNINIFRMVVPLSTRLPEADKNKMSIYRYAEKKSEARKDTATFDLLIDEILKREETK